MKTKFNGILTLLLAMVVQISFAQERTISGIVSDENGPLPGVSVLKKGTTQGTETDFDGKYSIKAKTGDVLVFSFVGMETVEKTVRSSNLLNVILTIDSSNILDGVVIQAYRTSSKEKSNISSTTILAEGIEGRPNPSLIQTLQGQVAGLNIATGNGQPGGNSNIQLRGVGSLSGNTEPLFIIDGVPVDEDNFRSLNPNDIESLSVLKDAAATAPYGNRGANGVILITTKKGKFNTPLSVKYTVTTGVSSLQDNDYNLMNANEQLKLEKLRGKGLGSTLTDNEINSLALTNNTDWLDVFFSKAFSKTHNLSFSSGGEYINTYTSLGYSDVDGILKKASSLKRFNFRNNINYKSKNDKFKLGSYISVNYSKNNEPNSIGSSGINRNLVIGALQSVPYKSPSEYISGRGYEIPVKFVNTPLFLLDLLETFKRNEDEFKLIANIDASYEITNYLTFKSSFGVDYTNEYRSSYEGPNSFNARLFAERGNDTPGFGFENVFRALNYTNTNMLTFRDVFADKHTIELSIANENFKSFWREFGFRQNGFDPKNYAPGDDSSFISDNSQNDFFIDIASATKRDAALLSYFALFDYDYDNKYGFGASLRRDASYRFTKSNKWGTFWSVSGRWNIHNESFMEGTSFNTLKLRASYGTSGNQNIVNVEGAFAPFAAANLTQTTYSTGTQYGGSNGLSFQTIGNSDLKWETIKQLNVGVDYGIFNNRLRGSFDYYIKTTEDLFLNTPISPSVNYGQSGIRANVGSLENSGFDFDLHYDIIRGEKDQDLNITLNFVTNYNKQKIIDLGLGGDIPFGSRVGGPISEIYAAPFVGVNPDNGNLLFKNKEGDITEDITQDDQLATGKNIYPTFQGSFGFDINYSNIYLTTQFNYVTDVYRYDNDYAGFVNPNNIGQFRSSRDILNSWQNVGDITDFPSLTATNLGNSDFSDRFLRKADYIRLRNIQLGYNVPKLYLEKAGLSSLKLYIMGENLVTFSDWRGLDAEAISATDFRGYPTPKTFTLGLEISL